MRTIIITGLCIACFGICLQGQVQVMNVSPAQTDPAVTNVHGDHMVLLDAGVKPLNKLLLMIVGTGAAAKEFLPFDSVAARMGYRVISIDYRNTVITTVCSNSEDSSCFYNFRQEIVFGEPVSPLVEVDSANSIYHRVFALLRYLAKKYPQQNWQQYLRGNSIAWQHVTVAGHSQGAGHAAYLGKKFAVDRVLIFAGPQDYMVHFNRPAGWLSKKGSTSSSRYFAFLHRNDPFDFNKQLADCVQLMQTANTATVTAIPGEVIRQHPHILVTDIETANPHGSMMQPAFIKAWAYLLSPPPVSKK